MLPKVEFKALVFIPSFHKFLQPNLHHNHGRDVQSSSGLSVPYSSQHFTVLPHFDVPTVLLQWLTL